MAKRRKGRKKGRRRRTKKVSRGRAKAKNVGAPAVAIWDGYKLMTRTNFAGTEKTLGGLLLTAPFDKNSRTALKAAIDSGEMKNTLIADTKEAQLYAGVKIAEKLPVVKIAVKPLTMAADSALRSLTKGKYVIFGGK